MWLFFSLILWLEPLWQMLSFFICLLIFKFSSLKFINIFLKKLLDTIKTVSLVKKLSIFAFFMTYWFSFLQLCLLLLLMLMFLFETGSFSLQCVLDLHSSSKALKRSVHIYVWLYCSFLFPIKSDRLLNIVFVLLYFFKDSRVAVIEFLKRCSFQYFAG